MPEFFEGHLKAKDFKFGIIVSRFNEFISQRLLDGALDALQRHGAQQENIKIYKVPGSFEIPLLASKLAEKQSFDAIICLGALIRGETPHFDYLSAEVTKGIATTALKSGIPVSYGVITTDTLEQAIDRAGAKTGNKGWDAAVAAIEMVNLYKNL
jgi:6,7-dimethyl-8-ribityllumazine synthase